MKVFISYRNRTDPDVAYATSLTTVLRGLGHTVFHDDTSIRGGDAINAKIEEAIDDCDCLVAFLSNRYLQSGYCRKELKRALASPTVKRVIPVVLPGGLDASLRFRELEHLLGDRKEIQLSGSARSEDLLRIAWELERVDPPSLSSPEPATMCEYLARYIAREEPPLLGNGDSTHIHYNRGYNLLLYMFHYERFQRFRAFDLAVHRWEELVNKGEQQTVNYSANILVKIENLLAQRRCTDFQRILVVPTSRLRTRPVQGSLRKINDTESNWRRVIANVAVETRVFRYHSANEPVTRRLAELCDFALFIGEESQNMAIVEVTQNDPRLVHPHPQMRVEARPRKITKLQRGFDEFWDKSVPLQDVLKRT